jgi:ankyrin repeat protein
LTRITVFSGDTPLHQATYCNASAIVVLLLAQGANVNDTKRDGNSPLHLAASRGK